jgi:hypothetical protein
MRNGTVNPTHYNVLKDNRDTIAYAAIVHTVYDVLQPELEPFDWESNPRVLPLGHQPPIYAVLIALIVLIGQC